MGTHDTRVRSPIVTKIKRQGSSAGTLGTSSLPSLAPLPTSALKRTLWPSACY